MKATIAMVAVLLLDVTPASADEEILPWDALNSEKGWRQAVESRFPELEFGCYHFNGDWFLGVLEDFDHDRVLLMTPVSAAGTMKITRNGEEVSLPLKDILQVRIAGASMTPQGTVSDPDRAIDQTLGFWLPLEATDRLSIQIMLQHPTEGAFHASYDPDNRWNLVTDLKTPKQRRREPADAYEISRRPLLDKVQEVLGKQATCRVRLRDGLTLQLEKKGPSPEPEFEPLRICVGSAKIATGPPETPSFPTSPELIQHLIDYRDAALSAGVTPRVTIHVTKDTSDRLFRRTLTDLGERARLMEVTLAHGKPR